MAAKILALAQAASSPRLVDKIRTCFDSFPAEGFLASGEHDFRTSQRGRGVVLCGLNDAVPSGSKCKIGVLGKRTGGLHELRPYRPR